MRAVPVSTPPTARERRPLISFGQPAIRHFDRKHPINRHCTAPSSVSQKWFCGNVVASDASMKVTMLRVWMTIKFGNPHRHEAGYHICRKSDSDRAKGETLRTVAAEQWR